MDDRDEANRRRVIIITVAFLTTSISAYLSLSLLLLCSIVASYKLSFHNRNNKSFAYI